MTAPPPRTVLMVSKPVVPPWNDSAKNLVRDVVLGSTRHRYRVLVTRGERLEAPRVSSAEIYGDAGSYTPGLKQNARVLAHLVAGPRADIVHYFFAPNPRTSRIARLVGRLRHRPTVQTVCSVPQDFSLAPQVLFADRVIVLSESTRRSFRNAGIDEARLSLIRPGIFPLEPLSPEEREAARRTFAPQGEGPVLLYAGDYQFSEAARTIAAAVAPVVAAGPARFIFACRIKQEASRAEEAHVQELLTAAGVRAHVRFWNEVTDMRALLGAADLLLMPAESLYAKMDIPLVVLEAMSLGVPILVADVPPLTELLTEEVGAAVPPRDPARLAQAILAMTGDPARLRAMGQKARAMVFERFSAKAVAEAYENVYDEVGVSPPPARA